MYTKRTFRKKASSWFQGFQRAVIHNLQDKCSRHLKYQIDVSRCDILLICINQSFWGTLLFIYFLNYEWRHLSTKLLIIVKKKNNVRNVYLSLWTFPSLMLCRHFNIFRRFWTKDKCLCLLIEKCISIYIILKMLQYLFGKRFWLFRFTYARI